MSAVEQQGAPSANPQPVLVEWSREQLFKVWSTHPKNTRSRCHCPPGTCEGNVTKLNSSELAFGVIARGESAYIEQWVLYHLFIGVQLIYLYDNEDVPTYHRMFQCNPRVQVRGVVLQRAPWTAALPPPPPHTHTQTQTHTLRRHTHG